MPASTKVPLSVFEVLEEEYIALHGAIYETEEIKLPDSDVATEPKKKVVSRLLWDFDSSHIKNPSLLASKLVPPATESLVNERRRNVTVNPDTDARNKFRDYLWNKLDEKTKSVLQAVAKEREATPEQTKLISEALNTVLRDPDLFAEERFSSYWLSDATKDLKACRTDSDQFAGDDLVHFNRLLIEDAFNRCFFKIYDIRLGAIYQVIHKAKQAALAFSGGGIRSGTFALGLLQGLSRHNLLGKFHYLSTVSGGGYIGSWLAAWINRHQLGLPGVTAELANSHPLRKVDPDPGPIRYLRRYSNFITPKVGLLSADTWTFIGIYLRNLFLNWVVFIPFLLSVVIVPRLIVAFTRAQPAPNKELSYRIRQLGLPFPFADRHFLLFAGLILTVWALAYIIFNRPTVREQLRQRSPFWRSRTTQRGFLRWCLVPLVLAAFFVTTYWAWSIERTPEKTGTFWLLVFGPGIGLSITIPAWLISRFVLGRISVLSKKDGVNRIITPELVALMVAGILGGLTLWILTSFKPLQTNIEFPRHYWSETDWTSLTWHTEIYACFAVPCFMLVFLLGATLFIGITSAASSGIDDEDREWGARLGAWALIVILGWAIFTTLTIFGPLALLSAPTIIASAGGLSGILAALLGKSAKTASSKDPNNEKGGLLSSISGILLPALATIFIAILLIGLSLALTPIIQAIAIFLYTPTATHSVYWWVFTALQGDVEAYMQNIYLLAGNKDFWLQAKIVHMNVFDETSTRSVLALLAALFGFGLFASRIMNLNIFSLHGGYRNRLIRAFLGASRTARERKPNPFTGFDPADNLSMHELRVGLFNEGDFPKPIELANALMDVTKPTSKYLADNGLLTNIENVPNRDFYSLRLVTALRKDLNSALQDENLYLQFEEFVTHTKSSDGVEGNKAREELRRTASHIKKNRRALEAAYPKLIMPQRSTAPYRMLPVINTTLNLVGGKNLAWQQRRAEPFSFTPLHSGCFRLGYRDSRLYGGSDGGVSIGTAAAISGAAASSNMGYYTTSAVLSLVLTFFNVRLGWWLGNPGPAGKDTFELDAPKYSVKPILEEALGLTDDRNRYVYLTDGGHFENLGLFEMVLRRNHIIIVSDAAADGDYKFGDLGNAIRKVRIDLGIPIEFTRLEIIPGWPGETEGGNYWALGKIRYSCMDGPGTDGWLLYIKPTLLGKEPRDVLEYKKSHPSFPHQTTADQFFDEPQFESYRILGSHIMDQLCGSGTDPLTLDDIIRKASDQPAPVARPTEEQIMFLGIRTVQ
ncbi:MAG TPA: hypothetical protein VI306_12460 [Pyrinomonadaceae bacterium]